MDSQPQPQLDKVRSLGCFAAACVIIIVIGLWARGTLGFLDAVILSVAALAIHFVAMLLFAAPLPPKPEPSAEVAGEAEATPSPAVATEKTFVAPPLVPEHPFVAPWETHVEGKAKKKAKREERKSGSIKTKVVGVTFANDDGTSRQRFIQKYCRDGAALRLIPKPPNRKYGKSVEVWVEAGWGRWVQIGHLRAEMAEELDASQEFSGRVLQRTGGDDDRNLGVNIEITPP